MVNLNKVELTKKGQSINLTKGSQSLGEIHINLNWEQQAAPQKKGFLSSLLGSGKTQNVDLDLGCLFELTDGYTGCVQALGNAFGDFNNAPYIHLDGDDRTGEVSNGENLRINGKKIATIKRVLIYAFIYEGAANWSQANGVVTLKYPGGADIEVRLNEHQDGKIMCAIAMIENVKNETFRVERLVEYFNGHQNMDRHYQWGMQWQAGSK